MECQRDKKTEAYLANLLPIYLSHLFSLDLCKLVFMSITGIYFPLLKNRACCLNSVALATFPPIQHNAILALYWLIFSVNNLQENIKSVLIKFADVAEFREW